MYLNKNLVYYLNNSLNYIQKCDKNGQYNS